jgi:carbonic anhydrase
MVIDEILSTNARFVHWKSLPHVDHIPRKHMALVTCMDCRLVQMFEQVLGLERGDVLEIRTAGATISEPERSSASNDLIRSLATGIYFLGVREVAVIGHTDCGLLRPDSSNLMSSMQALKVDVDRLIKQERLGDVEGLMRWLGAFRKVHVNVHEVVEVIRTSPYLPRIPVHGLVMDIATGKLELFDRGM